MALAPLSYLLSTIKEDLLPYSHPQNSQKQPGETHSNIAIYLLDR